MFPATGIYEQLLARIKSLKEQLDKLEDRISTVETATISHENRLQDVENESDQEMSQGEW